jgi:hypothetical protein
MSFKRHLRRPPSLDVSVLFKVPSFIIGLRHPLRLRCNELVATDSVYRPVPAVDNGSVVAQCFVGRKSGFTSCEGLGPSDKQFATTLMNHIRKYGNMDMLISDRAQAQVSQ